MGSSRQSVGFDTSVSPAIPASAMEVYRQFTKAGIRLQLRILEVCYGAKPPLRFYEITDSTGSQQPGKLRLANRLLDAMYEEQERNACNSTNEIQQHSHVEDDEDNDEEVDDIVVKATERKREAKTKCNQVKAVPTFRMCDDGTIVVRRGKMEIHRPYNPNMIRDVGLGPRSPREQARRDRLNAACRMSRARAKEGATRPYTFKKRAPKKSITPTPLPALDINNQEAL